MKTMMKVATAAALFALAAGCSELRPTAKSQTLTVLSFGLPAVAFVSETHMAATNSGDDTNTSDLDATNDVKPDVDVAVE